VTAQPRIANMTAVTPSRSGVSPSSSPRLPSPPPIPEVQFGPKSPGVDLSKELTLDAASKPDEGAARRIRPGTKAADMALGPPLVPLSQLDSPFQLQEHLKSLCSHLTHTPESTHTIPLTRETAIQLAIPPQINETESVDRNLWLYELCRFLTQKANIVSIFLMNDSPPCSSATCPEMRASEWQYLCAVHEPPKSCCAIDYCNHTLDWAANVLTSPKHFPSRLALGGEAGNAIQSMRQLTNIFRRVYRIFAHAWFQHRDVFWSVEATYGLYILFKVVCDEYHLIPEDSYTIPPEAEGGREATEQDNDPRPQILRRDNTTSPEKPVGDAAPAQNPVSTTASTGATTRRHKHTPSTGSHVATIAEGAEDEDEQPSSTVATKFNAPPGHLTGLEKSSEQNRRLSPQPPGEEKKRNEPSPDRLLPKLDIASTVPKYEPRAPEDPTPTGTGDDVDPLSIQSQSRADEEKSSNETANSTNPETPVDQMTRPFDGDAGEKVTSPSGGSIRTAGNDVLAAIMGHIHDGDEDGSSGAKQPKTLSPQKEEPKIPATGGDDEDVDDNESMSPVQAHAPVTSIGGIDENKAASGEQSASQDEVRISVEEAAESDAGEEQEVSKDDSAEDAVEPLPVN
jgi:hypothetical protein